MSESPSLSLIKREPSYYLAGLSFWEEYDAAVITGASNRAE